MPNKPTPKSKPTKNKRHIWLIATLALVLIIAGGIAYKNYRDAQLDQADKQKFETVRESVKNIHDRFRRSSGTNEEWKFSSSCRQSSEKYKEGQIYCNAKTRTIYEVASKAEILRAIDKYTAIMNQLKLFERSNEDYKNPATFPADKSGGLTHEGYQSFGYVEVKTGAICAHVYEVYPKEDSSTILEIDFSCSVDTRQKYIEEPRE